MLHLLEGGFYLMHDAYYKKYGISTLKCNFSLKKLKIGQKHHSWKVALFCHVTIFWRRIKFIIFFNKSIPISYD